MSHSESVNQVATDDICDLFIISTLINSLLVKTSNFFFLSRPSLIPALFSNGVLCVIIAALTLNDSFSKQILKSFCRLRKKFLRLDSAEEDVCVCFCAGSACNSMV